MQAAAARFSPAAYPKEERPVRLPYSAIPRPTLAGSAASILSLAVTETATPSTTSVERMTSARIVRLLPLQPLLRGSACCLHALHALHLSHLPLHMHSDYELYVSGAPSDTRLTARVTAAIPEQLDVQCRMCA